MIDVLIVSAETGLKSVRIFSNNFGIMLTAFPKIGVLFIIGDSAVYYA
jgi:hypothetical protein